MRSMLTLPEALSSQVYASFVDSKTGWLLTTSEPACGLMQTALFVTHDGGKTWSTIDAKTLPQEIQFSFKLAGCSMLQLNKEAKSPNSLSSGSINAEKPPSSISKTSIPSHTTSENSFTSIHMVDAMTGWASTKEYILRTDDGGENWTDITPKGIVDQVTGPIFCQDGQTAWITSYEVACPLGKERYFIALSTSKGIVWNPVPSMEGENLDLHPTSPYTLYLSPITVTKLDTNHAQKILELPLQMDSPVGKINVFLGSLFATKDWVGYDISLASPGMNHAYLSKLYAVNLTDKKNIFITDFHVGGGYQFGVGIKDNILLYDQWVPNSQNDFTHIIHTFDLNNGKQSEDDLYILCEGIFLDRDGGR